MDHFSGVISWAGCLNPFPRPAPQLRLTASVARSVFITNRCPRPITSSPAETLPQRQLPAALWQPVLCLLSRSLMGAKQTWPFAVHMSAFDPKRTSGCTPSASQSARLRAEWRRSEPGSGSRASARFHQVYSWFSSRLAAAVGGTARRDGVPHRLPGRGLACGIRARDRGSSKRLAPTRLRGGKKYYHRLSVCRERLRSPSRSRG
jgi:hypothetical protein